MVRNANQSPDVREEIPLHVRPGEAMQQGTTSQLFLIPFPFYPHNADIWPLSSTTPSWTKSSVPC